SGCEKKVQNRSTYDRVSDTRDKVKSILIASEDTKSSVIYFKLILNQLKKDKVITPFSCVFACHNNTHPTGVLDDLLSHTEKGEETYKDFDHLWIVIDRDKQWTSGDGHDESDFKEALTRAEENNVKVAYSNDSFELWYLLHFNYECSEMSRDDLNVKLKRELKKLDLVDSNIKSEAFVTKIYPTLVKNEATAIRNAEKLLEFHTSNNTEPHKANPSTTVHELVKFLRDGSK
ncbi:MAG: RloB family protein, partial [Thiomicrorhabdus sp.]|nr:RloB family protein [Thiomicrorhabdus sp.]